MNNLDLDNNIVNDNDSSIIKLRLWASSNESKYN